MGDHYAYLNQNYQTADRKNNKVYINPNYNRADNATNSSSSMHFNPNFSHITPLLYNNVQEQNRQVSTPRIYVNPNFIRKTNTYNYTYVNIEPVCAKPHPTYADSSTHRSTYKEQQLVAKIQSQPPPSLHITKSRYCLVRQKENVVTNAPITKSVNTTVRINKYKSVSMNVVKSNLAIIKHPKINTQVTFSHNVKPKPMTMCHLQNTSYQYFKTNPATALNQSQLKYAARKPSVSNNSLLKSVSQKKNKALMKKNNIPCPLFKKYGQCLRKMRGGRCEFSHDKKHVSICHKFLKGVCHENNCLLSHDLTDKKMPTCYFYLQGACNREFCPYLHVKLNEKTKICQEFLRGYCEKGEKCLFRHISASHVATKSVSSRPTNKSNSIVKLKSRKNSLHNINHKPRNEGTKQTESEPPKEHRYFKESVEQNISDETCGMIKPTRIKLGTLPSFIQL